MTSSALAEPDPAAPVRQPLIGPSASDAPSTSQSLSCELAADTVDGPSQQLLRELAADQERSVPDGVCFHNTGEEERVSLFPQAIPQRNSSEFIADDYHSKEFEFDFSCMLCRGQKRKVSMPFQDSG